MKIKPLCRDKRDYVKGSSSELTKVVRSLAPEVHPFERGREYVRALNAVKLDKHFSKPFVGALSGHMDGVNCMAKSPAAISTIISGGCDGEIIRWDLSERAQLWRAEAHKGFVRGLAFSRLGHHFVSASDDRTVKLWSASASASDNTTPLASFLGKHAFLDVDHHWKEHTFATGGNVLQLWDTSRSEPVATHEWGCDTVTRVSFNPASVNMLGCLSNDRSVTLYDLKSGSALQKAVMQTRPNAMAWNPMEPHHFTLASEDHCLYTFDMRKLKRAIAVHRDHVSAVLDVDYSPTGRQFVSGSYDRTIRIWDTSQPKSETCYHTKRMQRLFCVKWTVDSAYVLSGSDDTNVRLWRAKANVNPKQPLPREKAKREYSDALVEKFKYMPEVKRIKNHVHVPKSIFKATKLKDGVHKTAVKKDKNRRRHSKPGSMPKVHAKEKKVWAVLE